MLYEKIIAIAACDPKGIIGKKGKLPWHCPEDLKHFSDTIDSYPLILGYKTFLSLPSHYLENRLIFVFTHRKEALKKNSNLIFVSSLEEFLKFEGTFKKLYVAGGAQIYNLFLAENLIDEFILTELKNSYEGDTLIPIVEIKKWKREKIKETSLFTIYRYANSKKDNPSKAS